MDNGDNPFVPIGVDAMVGTGAFVVIGGLRLDHDEIDHCGRSHLPRVFPVEKIPGSIVGISQILVRGVKLFWRGLVSCRSDTAPYCEAF